MSMSMSVNELEIDRIGMCEWNEVLGWHQVVSYLDMDCVIKLQCHPSTSENEFPKSKALHCIDLPAQ